MNNQQFFVHQDLLKEAIRGLDSKKSLIIYGAFGSGKSPFVDKLISEYGTNNPKIKWVRVNFTDFPPETFETLDSLWRQIVISIASITGQDLDAIIREWDQYSYLSASLISTADFFVKTIKTIGGTLILVLENVHEVTDKWYVNSFFDNLRSLAEDRAISDALLFVVSMISDVEEVSGFYDASPFFNVSVGIHLLALSDEQISALLATDGFDNSEETIRKIKKLAGSNLYLISILLERALETGEDIREILESPDVHRVFDSRVERLRSLIYEVGKAEEEKIEEPEEKEKALNKFRKVLSEFKEKDVSHIEIQNFDKDKKSILDGLAKIGVLNRESRGTEILYSIQGEHLRQLINSSFSNF